MYKDEVTTWQKDNNLDSVYEMLRQEHVKKDHRYASNYHKSHTQELAAKSIYWDDDGEPMIVSSILQRPCWPRGVYRILNRAWKPFMNIESPFTIHHGWFLMISQQMEWCKQSNAVGVFMSRESLAPRLQKWVNQKTKAALGFEFETPHHKYLTCINESNPSCWQRIFYSGDPMYLQQWKCRDNEQ